MKRNRKGISYLVVPAVFTIVMAIIFEWGILPCLRAGSAQWQSIWIMNAPEYSYRQMKIEDSTDIEAVRKNKKRLAIGTQYGEISCDKWDTGIPLYYGDKEELLELGAGTYSGYGLPGDGKRVLIGGHDTTYFSVLEKVEEGNVIVLQTLWGQFTYKVDRMEITDANQALNNKKEAEQEELMLYTCFPFGKTERVREQRFIVYAHLQTEKVE